MVPLAFFRCRGPIRHTVAVVFADIKVYLVQLHCDVSVGVKRPRRYASGADKKKQGKRRLDNAVVQSLFLTTTAGQDGGTNIGGNSTTWTGSIPDARQPDGSRSLPAIGTLPSEVRSAILHHGPCRPKVPFTISSENGNRCMFSETHYNAHSGATEIKRQWLCFSPTTKKPSRQSCWLLDDLLAMQKEWDNGVSGKSKNFGVNIKSILHDVLGHTCLVRYQLIIV